MSTPGRGEQEQRGERAAQVDQVEPIAGLEDETRQQDDEDDLGRDRRQRAGDRDRLDEPCAEPDEDESDRVGQAERADDDRDDDGQAEQADEHPDRIEDCSAVHGIGPVRRPGRRTGGRCPSAPRPGPG